ncbi:MAG: carbon monoxide dehydrogenase [Acidobacteria bacterium]|nr:MAG: carbon monoxide dehydrogenase [Acidobacteriota bacterium]
MQPLDYVAPRNLAEALGLLKAKGDRARVLSGGTDLIVQVREDKRRVALMIDVKRIPELMELRFEAGRGLTLGASVPCYQLYESPELVKAYPGLIDAAELIGGKQIQNRASFGGNVCNSSPAADSIPALIAHSAVCRIAGAGGTREVPIEDFCVGPGKNVLKANEMLVSFFIPSPPVRFGAHYLRFIPRNEMDIAVVGCGVSLELSRDHRKFVRARIALGAVAPTPLLVESAAALQNQEVSEETIARAALAAQGAARPITDMRGTAEYRRHLVGVLTKRALRKAIERAKEA